MRRKRAIRARTSWSFWRSSSSVPFRSDRAVLRQTFLRGLPERALLSVGRRPSGRARPHLLRVRARAVCRDNWSGATTSGLPLSAKGSVQSVVLEQKSVLVSMSPSKGIRAERGAPPVCMGGSKRNATGVSGARATAEGRQGIKLADMHGVVTSVRLCHAARAERLRCMRWRAARPSTRRVPGWRRSADDVSRRPTQRAKRRRSASFGPGRGRLQAGAAERGDLPRPAPAAACGPAGWEPIGT